MLQRMKLSVLWHQDLLGAATDARPSVLDEEHYWDLFAQTPRSEQPDSLSVPWPPNQRQGFWEAYLNRRNRSLAGVEGRFVRRSLVPLHNGKPLVVKSPATSVALVTVEGLLHRWGATLIVTLDLRGKWQGFPAAAKSICHLRHNDHFEVAGQANNPLRLDDIRDAGLDRLREQASKAVAGNVSDPFLVFTLIDADGDPERFEPSEEAVRRFLHAVTSCSDTWEQDALPDLKKSKVAGISAAPLSHLVYGTRRARAVWFPGRFLAKPGAKKPTLSCHHRNLVLATAQTEAILGLADSAARRLKRGAGMSSELRTVARAAAEILRSLYEGSRSRYRSGSIKAQIDSRERLAAINRILTGRGPAGNRALLTFPWVK